MIRRRSALAGAAVLAAGGTVGVWALTRDDTPRRASREDYDQGLRAYASAQTAAVAANENGALAWGRAYVLQSLLLMYEAHDDVDYLDRFVRQADAVLARTDQARGVTDSAGRSGPVWRAGGAYTACHATLRGAAGAEVTQVRCLDPRSSEGTVEVRAGSRAGSFDLVLTHPVTGASTVADVSNDPADPRFVESVVAAEVFTPDSRWTADALNSLGVPAPGTNDLVQQYHAFAVHTGMISYPMARYARIVLQDDSLSRGPHRESAARLLAAAASAVAFHDPEWQADPDGAAGYVWQPGTPVAFDGVAQPFNQSHALGGTMAELYRVTRDETYRSRVAQLVAAWRIDLEAVEGYRWPYWPSSSAPYRGYQAAEEVSTYTPVSAANPAWEDVSHAGISVEFAVAAHGAGVGVTAEDLARFARSCTEGLRLGESSVRGSFLGDPASTPLAVQIGRWIGLGDPGVARLSLAVAQQSELDPRFGSSLLVSGYLNWAASRGLLT